ncbi:MAG: S9 family peptidase, partial [Planctomycetales bacterium]|nr:S9 family peptidase [Planctomycetales bacterium]
MDVPPAPAARRLDLVEEVHGRLVDDPYRWLEADDDESKEVAEWVHRQQAYAEAYLAKLPERDAFRARLTKLWDYERYSAPEKAGKRYLFLKNDGLQDQAVLYVADSIKDDGRVLIDPNQWSNDGTVSLSGYAASHDGRYLAYKQSAAGSDWQTIRVLDLETGERLADELKWVRFSGIEWVKSGEGFFYNRYPEPKAGQKHQSVALGPKVCFHKLGEQQSDDQVILERPDHPEWSLHVEQTHDGAYLFATMQRGTDWQNQLLYRKSADPDAEFIPLADTFDNVFHLIGSQGKRVFLVTDYQAPRRRVVAMDLDNPALDRLEEIIPQSDAALQNVSLIGGRLIATYLKDVAAEVSVYDLAGQPQGAAPLPGLGSANGFYGEPDDEETFFVYQSYNAAPSIYRYDVPTGQTTLLREPKIDFQSQDYEVQRHFYLSKDGSRIPLFLVYKKGLKHDSQNPTLLYGYGGFSISITPAFSISRLAWLERGGVLAVANLRGGGEYG